MVMDVILIILGIVCLIVGLLGCIIPMIPGPPISYAGILLLHLTDKVQFTTSQLLLWLLIVGIVQTVDYFTPIVGSKYSGGSRSGSWGCLIGTIIGVVFFSPWGIIVGPFVGAVLGELMGNRGMNDALKSGFGALIGFLLGTVLKVVVSGYFVWHFIKALF